MGMKTEKNPGLEILAPVGNAQMLGAAVLSGADAVYLGLSGFNARRGAGNFTPEELTQAVCFCHARGVAVHVALNTLVYDKELGEVADAVRAVAAAGADAVIVDDLAVAALVRAICPALHLHGSTQMSIHTIEGARELAALGYDRVILARELSLPEITAITAACPIETEVFIHGAMCMSMSGQCMMSAFLGGRSGNRGACAGPCRLPFDASPNLRPGQPGTARHLSLKDMDLIPHLQELMAAGVSSVKIEGRLRTPEYAAAAVAACRAARGNEPYDEALLRDIFSRSGFSDGYLLGKNERSMFGVRTELDAAKTKAATPKARELFRRELPRVAVDFTLAVSEDGAKLRAADLDGNTAVVYYMPPEEQDTLPPAKADPAPALEKSLRKTGGTPFFVRGCTIESDGGPWFLPGSAANELRREALEALLAKRSAPVPHEIRPYVLPEFAPHNTDFFPDLAARFESISQLPQKYAAALRYIIVPLRGAQTVPADLRAKTLLELPRAMFGNAEAQAAAQLAACKDKGFLGVVANNLAHLRLAEGFAIYGGLGLNITNTLCAARYAELGLWGMLLHPETALAAMRSIAPKNLPTAALCYGHLPLMLTRACPMKNVRDCAGCGQEGALRDRKARDFPLRCQMGARTIYNPVPLYMGDRLAEMPVDVAVAAFTLEAPERVSQILDALFARRAFDSEFTRGLYYTNN